MNLFELFVKIGVDDQASDKLSNLSSKLGNGLKTAAKIGTAAVGAAAAGITALTTAAVNNYAEYEQLVGGVDTLFKNASQKVQKYAADAYKTAGMSANDYMANATAFSASLISALGDDTEAAAEYANRAMVSMSDNANKMGTSIDSIVQTYQSLARGNFAMLDNLKLGYGGTKAELERLIADAASYTEIQKEMGITVDASSTSFDNIVNAIAVVQGKLGIAGATALEAGTTIEGSVNSMKAAWDNLITGVADKNADLEGLINNLVTSIVGDGTESNLGVLGNIMPAVKMALRGAAKVVAQSAPIIAEELPKLMEEILPDLASATANLIVALAEQIPSMAQTLVDAAYQIVDEIGNAFAERIPGLSVIFENLETVIVTVVAAFAALKTSMAISSIVGALTASFSAFQKANEGATIAQWLMNAAMNANPFVLVATLVAGLVAAVITLWNTNEDFLEAVIEIWGKIQDAFSTAWDFITNLWESAGEFFSGIWKDIKGAFADVGNWFSKTFKEGKEKANEAWSNAKELFSQNWENVKSAFSSVGEWFTEKFTDAKNKASEAWSDAKSIFSTVWENIKSGFNISDALTWGSDMIQNFIDGITAKGQALKDKVSSVAQTVKNFLGFSEPKEGPLSNFHTYAPDMMDLFAKGIRENESTVIDQIKKTFDFGDLLTSSLPFDIGSNLNSSIGTVSVSGGNKTEVVHSGTIRVEGVNDRDELVAVTEYSIENALVGLLRKQARLV